MALLWLGAGPHPGIQGPLGVLHSLGAGCGGHAGRFLTGGAGPYRPAHSGPLDLHQDLASSPSGRRPVAACLVLGWSPSPRWGAWPLCLIPGLRGAPAPSGMGMWVGCGWVAGVGGWGWELRWLGMDVGWRVGPRAPRHRGLSWRSGDVGSLPPLVHRGRVVLGGLGDSLGLPPGCACGPGLGRARLGWPCCPVVAALGFGPHHTCMFYQGLSATVESLS